MCSQLFSSVAVLILAAFLCFSTLAEATCNQDGWFGTNCQYQCHCAQSAPCNKTDGSCSSGCDPQWFGPACQYALLRLTESNWLTDNDDSTCYPNNVGPRYMDLSLATPVPLTWIRVVHKGNLKRLEIAYKNEKSSYQRCPDNANVVVDDHTMDFNCPTSHVVQKIFVDNLYYGGLQSLCSLYISGGRNVALKQPTNQSTTHVSNRHPWYSEHAVDGRLPESSYTSRIGVQEHRWYESSLKTCTHTKNSKDPNWWTVNFRTPVDVSRILIHNRWDCCGDRLKNFTLTALQNGSELYKVTGPDEALDMYSVVPSPKISSAVTQIKIRTRQGEELTLCEVEVFGELRCPTGRFGLACEHECHCNSQNNCFVHSGRCKARACLLSSANPTGPVDDSDCHNSSSPSTSSTNLLANLTAIIDIGVTTDNVVSVSTILTELTDMRSRESITPEVLDKFVSVLERCVTPDNLMQPGVTDRVVVSLSNLLDVDLDTLQSEQEQNDTSNRILAVIDTVADEGPLVEGRLKVVTSNLAVAAQALDERESRELTLTANTNSPAGNGLNDNEIRVEFTAVSRQPATVGTSLVLPVPALIQSLTAAQRRQLDRASFVVYHLDKLFVSMQKPGSGSALGPSRTVIGGSSSGSNDVNSPDSSTTGRYLTKVNSMILSASVPGVKVQGLSVNVTMTFEHEAENATNPRCVFWDVATDDWSSEGCDIVTSSPGVTQCGCDHLTNFALLMDVYQEETGLSSLDRKILSYISYIGCGVSLVALLLTLATYALFRKLRRDNPSKILINLCLALLLSNLVYLVGMHDYSFHNSAVCKVVAVLLHYSLMASLTWMAVEAFYMYLSLILVFKTYFSNFILKCSLFGWGVPLLIVVVTLAVNSTDNYGFLNSGMCWLRNPAFYFAFVGPVSLILLVNCIAFALVIRQLSNMASAKLNKTDRNNTAQRLRGAIGIVILLGLTWIFAIFAIGEASAVFYYLFAIFNSLQGFFIFIFYCILKKDAISAWKRVLPCFEDYGDSTKSSSNNKGVPRSTTNTNAANEVPSSPCLMSPQHHKHNNLLCDTRF